MLFFPKQLANEAPSTNAHACTSHVTHEDLADVRETDPFSIAHSDVLACCVHMSPLSSITQTLWHRLLVCMFLHHSDELSSATLGGGGG
jgi:hypothetical protein